MQVAGRHWVMALSFAVMVHAAVAAAILWTPPSSGAESDGRGGIEVLLSPEGGTPGSAAAVVSDLTEAEPVDVADDLSEAPIEPETALQDTAVMEAAEPVSQAAETELRPTPPLEDAAPMDDASEVTEIEDVAEAQPAAVEPVEAAEPVTQAAEAELQPTPPLEDAAPMDDASEVAEIEDLPEAELAAEPLEAAETVEPMETAELQAPAHADPPPSQTIEVAEAVAVVEAEPVQVQPEQAPEAEQSPAVAEVQPMEEVAARTVELPPVPRQKPPVPKRAKSEAKATSKSKAKSAAKPAPQRSSAGTSAGAVTASRGQITDYAAQVRARIASRRQATARARGKVVVSFAISSDGTLRYARISRSSGQAILDRAALTAVQRSSPFPRPPEGMTPQDLTYAVPFEFR